MRRTLLTVLLLAIAVAGLRTPPAGAMASHRGWPPYDGMLLMNVRDSSRPLDARAGFNPFGSATRKQGCKDSSDKPSSSCKHWMEKTADGYVMRASGAHHRLYGGHGDDRIHAGNNGDVIWGDYKPSGQPTSQRDRLTGGDGPDFIYPSHGRNVVAGGAGTDVIHARFGRGTIDCGPGTDVVYVHPRKRRGRKRAYKLTGCEVVRTRSGESAPAWILRRLPWPITDTQSRR